MASDVFFVFFAVVHFFLSPLLVAHGFIPVLLSNLLFMIAISYYHYLNFLGYAGKMHFNQRTYFGIPLVSSADNLIHVHWSWDVFTEVMSTIYEVA